MRLTRNCKIDTTNLTEETKHFAFMIPDYDYARNELGFATSNNQQCLDKLGQLEDLMEKYNIKTLSQVESSFIGFVTDYTEEGRNHIGELLKLEDELGIDLITLFKALKNGFYGTMYGATKEDANASNWKPLFYELKDIDIKKYDGKFAFIYYLGNMSYSNFIVYKFEKYGKTWALTKEELE